MEKRGAVARSEGGRGGGGKRVAVAVKGNTRDPVVKPSVVVVVAGIHTCDKTAQN